MICHGICKVCPPVKIENRWNYFNDWWQRNMIKDIPTHISHMQSWHFKHSNIVLFLGSGYNTDKPAYNQQGNCSSKKGGTIWINGADTWLKVFPHIYTFRDDILSIPVLWHSLVQVTTKENHSNMIHHVIPNIILTQNTLRMTELLVHSTWANENKEIYYVYQSSTELWIIWMHWFPIQQLK